MKTHYLVIFWRSIFMAVVIFLLHNIISTKLYELLYPKKKILTLIANKNLWAIIFLLNWLVRSLALSRSSFSRQNHAGLAGIMFARGGCVCTHKINECHYLAKWNYLIESEQNGLILTKQMNTYSMRRRKIFFLINIQLRQLALKKRHRVLSGFETLWSRTAL